MAHRNLPGLLRARGLNTLTSYESEVSAETTAIVGEFLAVDTTSSAVTINQPELPDVGALFGVYDSRENAGTNNITIVFTDPLHGTVQNHVISTDQGSAKFRYIDTDIGWVIYDDGKAASGGGGTVEVVSNVAQDRILGRISSGSGNSEELTKAQMLTFLNVEDGATADQDISGKQDILAEGAFADGDKTKLDGIETNADVTDTANVTSAGALMDSEVTDLAGIKSLDTSTLQVKLVIATEVSANATAVIGEDLPVNSTAAARTITAPGSPSAGDSFSVFDSRGTAATNNITVSSFLHHAQTNPYVISVNGGSVEFKYINGTIGWKIEKEVN